MTAVNFLTINYKYDHKQTEKVSLMTKNDTTVFRRTIWQL
ncbi:hypothetical protein SeKA_A3652 [Salmonella enterica subsp. enterica serovar Kentucky str. CVM29188]|nr:hypothetical protein SeKA_A3652 [Salmonella enterica subsp. enterica serovar Kentucky str. CVM29188]EDZ19611.1 hypothetical protein SeKB_A4209 [Salmonella enterica subsp. enterica serovar Kentucky str. CDC 191]